MSDRAYLTRLLKCSTAPSFQMPASKIILHGRSIGTGPATELAAVLHARGTPAGGLILQSPFLSVKSLAKTLLGAGGDAANLILDRFNNRRRITDTGDTPLLVIHGRQDTLIPHQHGEALHALSPAPHKYIHVLDGVDHNYFTIAHTAGPTAAFMALIELHPDARLSAPLPAGDMGRHPADKMPEPAPAPTLLCGASTIWGRLAAAVGATLATSAGVTAGVFEANSSNAQVDSQHPFEGGAPAGT